MVKCAKNVLKYGKMCLFQKHIFRAHIQNLANAFIQNDLHNYYFFMILPCSADGKH